MGVGNLEIVCGAHIQEAGCGKKAKRQEGKIVVSCIMGFCSDLQIKFIYLLYMCLSVLYACVCVPCVYPVLLEVRFSGTEVMERVSWACGHVGARN